MHVDCLAHLLYGRRQLQTQRPRLMTFSSTEPNAFSRSPDAERSQGAAVNEPRGRIVEPGGTKRRIFRRMQRSPDRAIAWGPGPVLAARVRARVGGSSPASPSRRDNQDSSPASCGTRSPRCHGTPRGPRSSPASTPTRRAAYRREKPSSSPRAGLSASGSTTSTLSKRNASFPWSVKFSLLGLARAELRRRRDAVRDLSASDLGHPWAG